MASSQSPLPEGTDSIVTGASDATVDRSGDYAGAPSYGAAPAGSAVSAGAGVGASATDKLGDAATKVGDATASLRAQAADKARDYAAQGKDRAVGALENVTRLTDEFAGQIDEKVGEQYGAYARQASQAIAGFADTLRGKDVEELVADARDLVRKSPAIAIGAAAAIGFVIARMVKAGASDAATAGEAPAPAAAPTPSTATTVPVDTTA
ncbi:hypothetical protein [Sphingomonas profundi]|uniref:hypothetical protein n=1 Tax=Alterirhizorhabdus profundi TaxID=2681549 RepID=UPI0012E77D39|nr:hypothetical protein [Sphingomonas profundi]